MNKAWQRIKTKILKRKNRRKIKSTVWSEKTAFLVLENISGAAYLGEIPVCWWVFLALTATDPVDTWANPKSHIIPIYFELNLNQRK